MKLSAAVEDYCECARYELGHSRSTFLNYRNRLRQFSQWLEDQGIADPPVVEVSYDLLRRYYLSCLVPSGVRPRTLRSHFHSLKCLFGYLTKQGVIDTDPSQKLKMPKLDAANRELVSDEELHRLLEAAGRQGNDFKAIRDVTVVSVLAFTAIRRSELLALKIGDVDLEERVLLVRCGKGSKSRSLPLCQEVCDALSSWLAYRHRHGITQEKLFTVDRGRPLGECGLAALVKEVAAIAGLKGEGRVCPHSIRHCAATRFLNNGATLKDCQVLLGHTNIKTTAVYLHADEQSIRPLADLMSFKRSQGPNPEPPVKERTPERSAFFQARRRAVR